MPSPEHPKNYFPYLKRVPDSYGTVETPDDLLRQAIAEQAETNVPQIIAFIGPLGARKSRNVEVAVRSLAEQTNSTIAVVSSEDALQAGQDPRLGLVHPNHKSGSYIRGDYHGGGEILGKAVDLARKEHNFVIIEAPAVTGFDIPGVDELIGMDRCTSALRNIARHEGTFSKGDYGFRMTALVSDFLQNLTSIQIRRILSFFPESILKTKLLSDLGIRASKTRDNKYIPGGTAQGTLSAEDDLNQTLSQLCDTKTIHFHYPNTPHTPEIFQIVHLRAEFMAQSFYPWLLGEYFKVPGDHAIVCTDNNRRRVTLDFTATDKHRYIPQLIRDGRVEELK